MNIEEYISSGVIQAIVLGLASKEEEREFEQLAATYPELKQARSAFEIILEKHAMANGVTPPNKVKDRFLEAIREPSRNTSSSNPPNIITMEKEQVPVRRAGSSRYAVAASVILLAGLAWFAYRSSEQNKELTSLKAVNEKLQSKYNSTDSILSQIIAERNAVTNPDAVVVNMVGTQVAPKSSANVYWDSASKNVFMVVKNMPKLPNDKQYQLWALIDGKPKDLGVFDATDQKVIIKMKNTQKADAFAITIEQKGGAPSPTLDKMQSMGKLKTQ